jgi:hypothetical protein
MATVLQEARKRRGELSQPLPQFRLVLMNVVNVGCRGLKAGAEVARVVPTYKNF